MKRPLVLTRLLTALLLLACGPAGAQVTTLNVATGTTGVDYWLLQSAANRFMLRHEGTEVRVLLTPELTDDRRTLLENFFEVGSPELDVVQLDVAWVAELAPHLLDLSDLRDTVARIHPGQLAATTVDGRLLSMPLFVDLGVLYYRSDLLAQYGYAHPPGTWSELVEAARTIQAGERARGNADFWGFVWQGDTYEGLTVNALEWIATTGGGQLLTPEGSIGLATPQAAAALEQAHAWLGDISPPAVLHHDEEDSYRQFVHGNAAFMRSWPAYHALLKDSPRLQGRYAVTLLPMGDGLAARRAAMAGGHGLAISAYSREPDLARQFVEFMSSEAEQRTAAIDGARIPTRSALWHDPQVLQAIPFLPQLLPLRGQLLNRSAAGSEADWSEISALVYSAVHQVLRGEAAAPVALDALRQQLQQLTGLPAGEQP